MRSFKELFETLQINELKLSGDKVTKTLDIYAKILSKDLGAPLKLISQEEYKRPGSKGTGYRYMNSKGYQVRFNWDYALSRKKQFILTTIDFWKNNNTDFERPSITVQIPIETNTLQVLKKVSDIFKTGKINEGYDGTRASRKKFIEDHDLGIKGNLSIKE